jgi:hypothetical protein
MLREFNLINREALLLMIEHTAAEAATKAVAEHAAKNPPSAGADDWRLLNRKEAAGYLRISIATLDKWRKAGIVPTLQAGNARPLFRVSDLKAALRRDDITK